MAVVTGMSSARGSVMLDPNHTSLVSDVYSPGGSSSVAITSLPPPTTTDQASGPAGSAYSSFTLSPTSGFSILVSDYATSFYGFGSSSSNGTLYFQATDPTTTYALNGNYTYSGSTGSTSRMVVTLTDVTTGQTIGSFSDQSSSTSESGTFTVADPNGTTTGNLLGTLQQHDVYEFQYAGTEQAPPPQFGSSSSGNGTLGISFSDASPVPEPATALLFAPIAIVLCCRKRRPA
jgi:hypothetical protein